MRNHQNHALKATPIGGSPHISTACIYLSHRAGENLLNRKQTHTVQHDVGNVGGFRARGTRVGGHAVHHAGDDHRLARKVALLQNLRVQTNGCAVCV